MCKVDGTSPDGVGFLEANRSKDGVVTLASGLQYRVIRQGAGLDHPTPATLCECHYTASLPDGTEVQTSRKTRAPATFAPKQAVKAWEEALQLMVEGDKWELCAPVELARSADGDPSPETVMVYEIELIKIRGASVPKHVEFPEWSAEQLALWTERDEISCLRWRKEQERRWADGTLEDDHADRAAFNDWLEAEIGSAKNRSLWRRTHGERTEPPFPLSRLSKESARALLTKSMDAVRERSNQVELQRICEEFESAHRGGQWLRLPRALREVLARASQGCGRRARRPDQGHVGADDRFGGGLMARLVPALRRMMGPFMAEYGFAEGDLMDVILQLQTFAPLDDSIAADVDKLVSATQGNVRALLSEGHGRCPVMG